MLNNKMDLLPINLPLIANAREREPPLQISIYLHLAHFLLICRGCSHNLFKISFFVEVQISSKGVCK